MGKRQVIFNIWWPERPGLQDFLRRYLVPHPGTLIMILLLVAGLLWAQSVGALPQSLIPSTQSISTSTIAYQGRLADADGNPLTGTYNMIFRLYDVPTGGAPLWEEQWTGSNGVQVSDGLFNVMLGSLTPIPQSVITGHDSLFLGITVGTDDEMTPRVQLGSVPFAVQALTVPDGSVTTEKIADGAVTQAKLADGAVTQTQAPSLIASGTANNVKLFHGSDAITATSNTTMLHKTVFLPQPCTDTWPKVWVQPYWHWHPSVIATMGLPWDNTKFTVFFTGPTWSSGQEQDFNWIAICEE